MYTKLSKILLDVHVHPAVTVCVAKSSYKLYKIHIDFRLAKVSLVYQVEQVAP